jgi:hypothetical protein
MWPIAAAAAISLALFWGVAVFAQHATWWLFWAESLPHRHGLYRVIGPFLPLGTVFGVYFPMMMAVGVRQRKNLARRKPARRGA